MNKQIKEKADNYMRGRAMALSFKPLSLEDVKEAYLCGAEDYVHLQKESEVPLADQYKEVCNAYRDALNEMWDTNGDWLDNDMWWFDVADCVIGIAEVRELVDRKVDFDTFLAWYDYGMQIHYAESLGKPVNRINLHTWLNGYPEDKKVPKVQLDVWEKEYWANLVGDDNSEVKD